MNQKSAEELLAENARLRGDLLTLGTRISHDLRAPLSGILNTAELLKEIFKENEIPAEFNSIFQSVDEIMQIIKSVSLLAKASANPTPPGKIKMSGAAYRAWQRLERQILKCGASVDIPDAWPEVFGVSEWLECVWWNFLSNALQHGGREIEMGWRKEGDRYKFFVRDNGNGVPPERRAKLFQPFEELNQSSSSSGLGLAMSRRLVELQNGNCGCDFDGGSTFYFTLPALVEKPVESMPRDAVKSEEAIA